MVSLLPTMSSRTCGLYFSTLAEMMRWLRTSTRRTYHGSSYGRLLELPLPVSVALPFAAEVDMTVDQEEGMVPP